MTVRIAVVTDIHHGDTSLTKMGGTALGLLDTFASYVSEVGADLVLELGDRISDVDRDTDLRLEREVAEAFGAIDVPVHHITGNHDRDHLSIADNAEIFGQSLHNERLDLGDWQLLLWRADSKIHRGDPVTGFHLPESDLIWLSQQIQAAEKPTLVVSHVPVSGHAQTGNYYFERNPEYATYPQTSRIRAALAQAMVPVACLAGHVHWNSVTSVDGIAHLTQQSLTESFTTQGKPAGAMGVIELGGQVSWQVAGNDPFAATVTPVIPNWTPPLPPFAELRRV